MGVRGELFSTKVALQNRTYFFNVKENRLGDLYLNIVESKNKETGGFDRQSVILFADDLQQFLIGFDESLKVMEKAQREKKKGEGPRRAPGPEREHRANSRSGSDERKPRTGRKDSEGPKPRTYRSASEGSKPRTYRSGSEGSKPRTFRKDSESPRPHTYHRDGDSPTNFRRDDDRPRTYRKDDKGRKQGSYRKDDNDRNNRFSKDKPPKGKPSRRVVRKKD